MIPYIIAKIVLAAIDFYVILIVAHCILTWVPSQNKVFLQIKGALDKIVGPYLRLFQKIIPTAGGIDFSPILAILVLQLVARLLF